MALQTTIGPANDIYVTKTAFYWSIGIIILLLAAISFSMARDITRLTASERVTPVQNAGVESAEPVAPPPPPPLEAITNKPRQ